MLNYMMFRISDTKLKGCVKMGRKKVDRSDKIIQTFETTRPLKIRLREQAKLKGLTVSALIREILEKYFEDRRN